MKDGMGASAVSSLAAAITQGTPGFARQDFIEAALLGLEELELKERAAHITRALGLFLPDDYQEALPIVLRAGEAWRPIDPDDPFRSFGVWPLIDYVSMFGLAHFDLSMQALRALTPLFSSEFAIRFFLLEDTERALSFLERWTTDPDDHVRRLVSEGSRPRLPWAPRLPGFIDDPTPLLGLLDTLKDDPSLYVRRSVANNLNDIAKDNPDTVIELCKRWKMGASAERQWIIRHATRTLVKQGHPGVWGLLGYTDSPAVEARLELKQSSIHLGDSLEFGIEIHSTSAQPQKLVIDYALHLIKANGALKPKVFKLRNIDLAAGQHLRIDKRHPIKKISTRRYYPGVQEIELLVCGTSVARGSFKLIMEGTKQ